MALKFHPSAGAVLLCTYQGVPPEMVKRRPAVVITPRLRRRDGLCAVVPLSSTAPDHPDAWHCTIKFERQLPSPWGAPHYWVKADMVATVGFHRLELIGIGRDQEGKRKYLDLLVTPDDLLRIRRCVLHGLGLASLTAGP